MSSEPNGGGSLPTMPARVPELIEVRPDEGFDVNAVGRLLDGRIEGASGAPEVLQFGGGHANLTFLLRYPTIEYVLRRPPLGPLAPSSHDMTREYQVLSRLWQSFSKAPRAFYLCEDASLIGAPFLVMERRHGIVVRNEVPPEFGGGSDPKANHQLSTVVIDALAELHAVDPRSCGLEKIGHPGGFLERQIRGWGERWDRARHEENPTEERVRGWIESRIPTSPPPTLIHNDWRLDNMAVASDDPGRCTAVYDWDMCTRGDPLADLGTTLATWYSADETPATLNPMPTAAVGFMSREQAIARYAEASGRDVSDVTWYVVFGTWKLAVVLQQIYIRWLRGQTHDERFSAMGKGAARLLELAEQRAPAPID